MKIRNNSFEKFRITQFLKHFLFKCVSPIGIFWIFFLSLIFIFTFFVPPFQKPDEQLHFWKAMALAKGQFQCQKENGISYFILPHSVINFPDQMSLNTILMRPDTKFPIGSLFRNYPFKGDKVEKLPFQYCSFPSVGYIPYALGALASIPLNNLLITFYFMRILSALVFIVSVVLSIRIIPKRYRLLIYFFSSIPMLIHQTTAVSYDAISFSLGILLFSLFCKFIDEKKITYRNFLVFLSITLLFSIVKYGYYFVYLFPILLLPKLPIKKSLLLILSGIFILIAVVCYLLFADNANAIRNFLLNTQTSPQLFMMLHYPFQFLWASVTAAITQSNQFIQGIVGAFGWQDYTLSPIFTSIYILIGGCVLMIMVCQDRKVLSNMNILLLFSVILGNFILMYAFFYLILTPVAYFEVIGMQGRYFLVFIPFIIYGLSQSIQYIKTSRTRKTFFIGSGAVILVLSIGLLIYNRYFYYGRSFSNPNALVERINKGELEISELLQTQIIKPISFASRYPIEGSKIGGFQLIMPNERYVTVPYQYSIKDSSCTIVLNSGLLDRIKGPRLSHLLGEKDVVYTQYIAVTFISEKSLCLELNPLPIQGGTPMILLGNDPGVPVVDYLSIIQ